MPRSLLTLTTALALTFTAVPMTQAADGLAGPYLAARQASTYYDYDAAARYYARANLADPQNTLLMERAAISYFAIGRVRRAAQFAGWLEEAGAHDSQIGQLIQAVDLGARGDWDTLLERFDAGKGSGPLSNELVQGWTLAALGRQAEAEAMFDTLAEESSMRPFARYHMALSLVLAGDDRAAYDILTDGSAAGLALTTRALRLQAELLARLDQREAALDLLARWSDAGTPDSAAAALAETIRAGDPVPLTEYTSAQDGMAEVFLNLADALRSDADADFLLLYVRAAAHLRPNNTDALLFTAELLEELEQYDLAVEAYDGVPATDSLYATAEIGRANALQQDGEIDAAVRVLQALAEDRADLPGVHSALGDALRRADRFEEATRAYDTAIDLLPADDPTAWFLHYVRAITYERTDRWPEAEADFRRALELNPGQPQVLNYLGYSLVQKQMKLDEALDMIQRAVEASPNSGYIVDSLAWVLFTLGRYDEAVPHMIRAAELMPIDPVVSDHLGDVLWAVGREREARFQWKRSLSFVGYGNAAEEVDPDRLRRKLDVGLDVVREEEGLPPLHPLTD